jgi:DICT domain-containing protein/predicted DNA-binding transcriptional regulator AlpA
MNHDNPGTPGSGAEDVPGKGSLPIREVVEQTGVAEATLRAWENRHGFPEPVRLPSGHRRYREADVRMLRLVAELRDAGLPVKVAIDRARARARQEPNSIFAELRALRPELQVNLYPKRSLVPLSHAIEDEGIRGSADLLLFGAFQHERHYRDSQARWRELSLSAKASFAFADFTRVSRPDGGPVEVPIDAGDPLAREWSIVCETSWGAACLAAWEPPGQEDVPDSERLFETIWTADRDTVRSAARICCRLASGQAPQEVERISRQLEGQALVGEGELRRAESLTGRMVAYLAATGAEPG